MTCNADMEKYVKTVQKVVEGGIAQLASQPTLGLFFLREHVISAAPTLLEDHRNSSRLTRELERGSFDAESASESMVGLKAACGEALTSIEEQLTIATQALTSLRENERSLSWSRNILSPWTPRSLRHDS